jgi:MtN3 and saliva related transmembrane protein
MPRSNHRHIKTLHASPKKRTLLDNFIYVVAIAEPLGNLPQIYTIYSSHQATGVSITSWMIYAFFALTWLAYGVHAKVKPSVVAGTMFFLTDVTVIIGAWMYGGRF